MTIGRRKDVRKKAFQTYIEMENNDTFIKRIIFRETKKY